MSFRILGPDEYERSGGGEWEALISCALIMRVEEQ
jgi:hypothetical protein